MTILKLQIYCVKRLNSDKEIDNDKENAIAKIKSYY